MRYAMIGSGSWATALVKLLLNHQEEISWHIRDKKAIAHIQKYHHNKNYLQSVNLDPTRIKMSTDINEVIENADVLVFCTPSAYVLKLMSKLNVSIEDKFIVSAIKGFVDEKHLTIAEYVNEIYNIHLDRIGIISMLRHAE